MESWGRKLSNWSVFQVAFLSAIVGSDAASAAAQAAISAQSRIDLNDEEIDSSINSTREEGISSALRNHVFAFSFAISAFSPKPYWWFAMVAVKQVLMDFILCNGVGKIINLVYI